MSNTRLTERPAGLGIESARSLLRSESIALTMAIVLSAVFHAAMLLAFYLFPAARVVLPERRYLEIESVPVSPFVAELPEPLTEAIPDIVVPPIGRVLQDMLDPEQVEWDEPAVDMDIITAVAARETRAVLRPTTRGAYGNRSPGNRAGAALRWGGISESERAVEAALAWLARHQSVDGHWEMHFPLDLAGRATRSPSYSWGTPAVSALALMVFLGAGYTDNDVRYGLIVRRAVEYILRTQDADGCMGGTVERHMYNHAICSLALGEACALMKGRPWRSSLERAVRLLTASQKPDGGWRYDFTRAGASDTSVTGWAVMALKSAQTSGVTVPESTLEGARDWFRKATYRDGTVFYQLDGAPSISCTAIGLFCKQLLGVPPDDPQIGLGAGALLKALPPATERLLRDEAGRLTIPVEEIDYYYWYYASLALFQRAGNEWNTWNRAMKATLMALQRTKGEHAGSWDPHGAWASSAGRTCSTAMAALTLEVYYRYLPLYEKQEMPDAPLVAATYDALSAYREFCKANRTNAANEHTVAERAADALRKAIGLLAAPPRDTPDEQLQRFEKWRRHCILQLASVEIRRGRFQQAIALLERFGEEFAGGFERAAFERLLAAALSGRADQAATKRLPAKRR